MTLKISKHGMRAIGALGLTLALIATLMLPAAVYAAKPDAGSNATDVEIVKKVGIKGVPQMGPPSKGPKPHAATGILGEEVTGERYAIIIGISDYPGPFSILEGGYDLFYADDDALAMELALEGYGFTDIRLLVDTQATRDAILTEIDDLKETVTEDDEVVFFFSGHSARLSPKPTQQFRGGGKVGIATWGWENSEDPDDFYLEVIWDNELKEAFKGFETDRIIFIFDMCLAGGMNELGGNGRVICMATTQNGLAAEYGEDYPEAQPPYINHGFFTYFFVELGMLYGVADNYPADGEVTVEEAYDFSRVNLELMSTATPGLWQIPTIKDSFRKDLLP